VKKHVLILGAGFGGLELATRLSETMSDAVRVTLLDRNDSWYFGYSKLDAEVRASLFAPPPGAKAFPFPPDEDDEDEPGDC